MAKNTTNRYQQYPSGDAAHLIDSPQSLDKRYIELRTENAKLKTELANLRNSNSWKLTRPLRVARRVLTQLTCSVTDRFWTGALIASKSVLRMLPLPKSWKQRLVASVFPVLRKQFAGTLHYELWQLSQASSRSQDVTFPVELTKAERILVVVVPEHNTMSGGIYSMFSIANQLRRIRRIHGYEIIIVTRPNSMNYTYFRNTNFTNSENVYRFEQLKMCVAAKELYIMLPEYAANTFVHDLDTESFAFVRKVGKLNFNILTQNIRLMPEPKGLNELRFLCADLTQSVAHHAYFNQEMADRYDLPTLLLPAYTDLSPYPGSSYADKKKLIIYSPDWAPYKAACLARITRELPHFELVEISGITFDKFMSLATDCMFSITFGEGFDGYLAQPIYQGGIGFAVFDQEFFPSRDFLRFPNIFSDSEDMISHVCTRIRDMESDPHAYEKLNQALRAEYERLYSYDDYVKRIERLSLRQFDLYPRCRRGGERKSARLSA